MSTDMQTAEVAILANADSRRLDIDAKQQLVAKLLQDCECEGLLVLHPANFRWLTSGANPVGLYGRDESPGLYFNHQQRWLLASSVDSPRLFAEDLDGLGFHLKEWHWAVSREQMLADLIFGRKVAADQTFRDCKHTGAFFVAGRRRLTGYETERLAALGALVVHAVEATARNFSWGDSEAEIAGHVAHRLMRRGVEPVAIQVSADGRGRDFRRRSYGMETAERSCVLQATGRKFGLHATVSRTVSRGPMGERDRAEFDAVLRLRAAHLAHSGAGERVAAAVDAGKALLRPTAFEYEWRLAPPVVLTAREPSEGVFLAAAQDRWIAGWAAVWQERIGAAALVDTYCLEPDGWKLVTPCEDWPGRRAVLPNRSFDLADVLVRAD